MNLTKKALFLAFGLSSTALVGCGGGGSNPAVPDVSSPILIGGPYGNGVVGDGGNIDSSNFANVQTTSGITHYEAVKEMGVSTSAPSDVELVAYRSDFSASNYMSADAYELKFYDATGQMVDVFTVESMGNSSYLGMKYFAVNDPNSGQLIVQDHDNLIFPGDFVSYGIWNKSPDGSFDGSRGAFALGDMPMVNVGTTQTASLSGGIIGQEIDGHNAQVAVFAGDVQFDANFSTNQITNFSVSNVTQYSPSDTGFVNGSSTNSYDMTGSNITISQDSTGYKFSGDVGNGSDLSGKTVGRFYGGSSDIDASGTMAVQRSNGNEISAGFGVF